MNNDDKLNKEIDQILNAVARGANIILTHDASGVRNQIIQLVRDSEWLPIETAPTDGIKILLLLEDDRVESGRWIEIEEDQVDSMGHDAGWMSDSGWTFPGRSFGSPEYLAAPTGMPTHWKPLPSPPKQP